ncbi:MAG: response regulator [Spirochaetia bacterium]|nr:response regulator [Spirochaetia bacterium]
MIPENWRRFAGIILVSWALFPHCSAIQGPPETVKDGNANLSNWDFETQGTVSLDGTWHFYWNQLVTSSSRPEGLDFLQVPGAWNAFVARKSLSREPGIGFGTLHVHLQLPQRDDLVLSNAWTASAFRMYCDDRLLASSGRVSAIESENVPINVRTTIALGHCPGGNLYWQISNFHHDLGGARNAIRLGTREAIEREVARDDLLTFGLMALTAFLGLSYFSLWLLRRNQTVYLLFAGTCFATLAFQLAGAKALQRLFSGDWFEIQYKLGTIGAAAGLALILAFSRSMFDRFVSIWIVTVFSIISILLSLCFLLVNVRDFAFYLPIFFAYLVLGILIGFVCAFRAAVSGRPNAVMFTMGLGILLCASLHDILILRGGIPGVRLLGLGFSGMLAMQALMLVRVFAKASEAAETLKTRLQAEVVSQGSKLDRQTALLESASDMWLIADETGTIQDASPRLCMMLRYKPQELHALQMQEIEAPPVQPADWLSLTTQLRAYHGNLLRKTTWVTSDGRVFPVVASLSMHEFDGKTYVVCLGRDDSEQHRTRQTIEQQRLDLNTLMDNVPSLIGYWDADLRNRFANKAYMEWFGVDAANVRGKHIREVIGEERYVLNLPYIEGALRGEKQVFERTIPTPAGETYHSLAQYIPDLQGTTVRGFYVIVTDISALKKAEIALRKAKDEAEAASNAKSAFLASMSHEIRTPMNAILGSAQILRETAQDAEQQKYLEILRSSGETLIAIISDILDLSKIEAGKMDLEPSRADIGEIIKEVAEMLGQQAQRKGSILNLDVAAIPPVQIDRMRLKQVLLNLGSNAVKFTETGTIDFTASILNETTERVELKFSVRDTGIGIPATELPLLFQPFTQIKSRAWSDPERQQGTGLGLAISQKIVQMMGGNIEVKSEEGRGSEFYFSIECDILDQAAPASDKTVLNNLKPVTILLAEDNPVNQMIAEAMLRGHHVTLAGNGREALDHLRDKRFDVVFMDLQMPEMDGLEATQRIRAGECGDENAKIPIIAMTAYATQDVREQCAAAGINVYITKPLDQARLLFEISQIQRGEF